jgi:hypothetical protein
MVGPAGNRRIGVESPPSKRAREKETARRDGDVPGREQELKGVAGSHKRIPFGRPGAEVGRSLHLVALVQDRGDSDLDGGSACARKYSGEPITHRIIPWRVSLGRKERFWVKAWPPKESKSCSSPRTADSGSKRSPRAASRGRWHAAAQNRQTLRRIFPEPD